MAGYPYDAAWRKVRALVLRRDGWLCQLRLPGCKTRASQVDHIIPLADGGPRLDPSNLRAACKPCNVSAGNTARDVRRCEPRSERW